MEVPFAALGGLEGIDVCVVGSGPAGMTCARELAARGRTVLLLEAGDREISQESQELYDGDIVGDEYNPLDAIRLRFLGGTSNHWAGQCRPLDAIDFEGKGEQRLGRWPITKADLDPFLMRACDILEIARPADDIELPGGKLKQIAFTHSPPVRFGDKYLQEILASPAIRLCLNCNVTQIDAAGGRVASLTVKDHHGNTAQAKAKSFVIACGGIENSRLLLWSNIRSNGELLKQRGALVGHHWFDHLHFFVGAAIMPTDFNADSAIQGERYYFSPTAELMREHGTLNCGLRVFRGPRGTVKELIEDIACVAPSWANWAFEQLHSNSLCTWTLKAHWEQEPRFGNYVGLGEAKDRLGLPRVELHWTKSALDLKTVRQTTEAFGVYLAEQDIGRVRLSPWVLGEAAYPAGGELTGPHPMGGTRMGDDQDNAIVDRDCRLFEIDNLYLAGSSVFPSGGHSNPTLTIVQLALRLADHLAAKT
jgi:choline dehydrogenase-like flavoprotein